MLFSAVPLCRRFNLIDPKETEVLHDLEVALRLTEDSSATNTSSSSNSSGGDSTTTAVSATGTVTAAAGSEVLTTTTTECGGGNGCAMGLGQVAPTASVTAATAAGGSGAVLPNQTGAIKCKSSINCGVSGGEQQQPHNQPNHHHHHHGEGCGSGCTESMYPGALDMRPPIVNQPESGENNNVFT